MMFFFIPFLFILIFFLLEFICVSLYDLYHRYIRHIYPFCGKSKGVKDDEK